jgi:hypothetical protein
MIVAPQAQASRAYSRRVSFSRALLPSIEVMSLTSALERWRSFAL